MILLLNAPPSSGKDFMADYLVQKHGFIKLSFAAPIKEATMRLYNLPESHVESIDCHAIKDKPLKELGGRTPRQAYIWLGEGLKSVHGLDYWTNQLVEKMHKFPIGTNIVIKDLGFDYEAEGVNQSLPFVEVAHIIKEDTDFENDSRDWVDSIGFWEIENDGSPAFLEKIDDLIKEIQLTH